MTDTALVATVLIVGGVIFLSTFLWITVVRVREIGPPAPPHSH
ncbi:MAG TPA: hypothetical protein VKT51_04470 [Candidatus Eremiobacteraceae bacterium]|jgi:hypothetical protein|nr:hypothetical protein [Candidatus Eremiobacteraceae bacterium]